MKKFIFIRIWGFMALMSLATSSSWAQVNLIEMAKGAYEAQNYKEAANYLYQILQNDQTNAEAYLLYGKVYTAVDNYPEAATILSYALSKVKEPENRMKIRLDRIKALSHLKIHDSALNEALKLKDEYPKNAEVLTTLAMCQNECRDTLAALNTLRAAFKINKNSTDIRCLLIEALVAQGEEKEALKELDALCTNCMKLPFDINNHELSNDFMFSISTLFSNYPKIREYKKTAHLITDIFIKSGLLPMEADPSFHEKELVDELASYVELNRDRIVNNRNEVSDYERLLFFVGALYSEIEDFPTALSYLDRCINSELPEEVRLPYTYTDLFYCGHIEKIRSITNKELERISKNTRLSSQDRLDLHHKVISRCAYYMASEGLADETLDFCNEYGIYHDYDFTLIAHYIKGEYDKALVRMEDFEENTTPTSMLTHANILSLLNRQDEANETLENVIILTDEESDLSSAVAYAALGDTAKAYTLVDKYVNSPNCHDTIEECFYLAAIYIYAHDYASACDYIELAMKIDEASAYELINNNLLLIVPPSFFSGKEFVSLKTKLDARRQELFQQTEKYFK